MARAGGSRGRVTEVVGPAGSGKTLGVAGWVRRRTPADASATSTTRWRTATSSTTVGELRALVAAVGADVPFHADRTVRLVIDNAERLDGACLRELERLLDERPPGLNVVLISRWDLALRRLAAVLTGAMVVVRGDTLRLTDAEARRLVTLHAPGCPVERVDAILDQARGWCAAVVLGARAPGTPHGATAHASSGPAATLLVGQEALAGLRPRERHVVLSVCREATVTAAEAARLSGDPAAPAVLEVLEETGLLVERDRSPAGTESYRVHPILAHVARRRMAEDGAEPDRANAAVARAAEADLADGRVGPGLRRTLAAAGCGPATVALARHGLAAVLRGEGAAVGAVVARCTSTVEAEPRAWLAAAVERWWSGDTEAAGRWCDRLLAAPRADGAPGDVLPARLLRLQAGGADDGGTTAEAAASADGLLAPADSARQALVADLLGAAHAWSGDLPAAERCLAVAVEVSRAHGFRALETDALGRLALTELLRGRPARATDLAARALRADPGPGTPAHVAADAALARLDPWRHAAGTAPGAARPGRDRVATHLAQLSTAQRLVVRGHVTQAEQALAVPLLLGPLPHHLAVHLLVRRALVAVAAEDTETLREVATDLLDRGAAQAAALVEGFRSIVGADLTGAAAALRVATTADDAVVLGVALVTTAQVTATEGDRVTAGRLLAAALRRAEHRRDAISFLGWVGGLVPLPALLADLPAGTGDPWGRHVVRSVRQHGSVVRRAVPGAAPDAVAGPFRPPLTVREQDVLAELARGATYADIAGALVVSSNTVKTHVGSLYAKLGVTRRSEALATARALGLV